MIEQNSTATAILILSRCDSGPASRARERRQPGVSQGRLLVEDVAQGEPELCGHRLDAQVTWHDLGFRHMTLGAVEYEIV